MTSRHLRTIRKISRAISWIAAFLTGAMFLFANDSSDRLFALMLLAITIVALAVNMTALWYGQMVAQRELAEAMATGLSGQPARLPIILFLRSADVAEASLLKKLFSELRSLFVVAVSAVWGASVANPPRYDAEEEIDKAVGNHCFFVAIGDKHASYGAAKVVVDGKDWEQTFHKLTDACALIMMLPGASTSALWEVSQILASERLLRKTVFIMPRQNPDAWKEFAAMARDRLGLAVPPYTELGRALRLRLEDRKWDTADLEGFMRALKKYVAGRQVPANVEIDVAALWQRL
jgi:hypothetical protein